ncbi:MAG TPA: hypothetical protein VKV57_10825 [bacterium]|nr:hypothetical protein [bacterium]
MAPADVQMYWLGFLTAAGHIWGQGSSLTLVVTLGEESRDSIETLIADLATDHVRYEFCRSNILGWQVYLRDEALCKALFPWGVPSALQGDDPALLDDLPKELAGPFIRGYADGSRKPPHSPNGRKDDRCVWYGSPEILTGIKSMIQRLWGISGVVSKKPGGAELRFTSHGACRTLQALLDAYPSRAPAGAP